MFNINKSLVYLQDYLRLMASMIGLPEYDLQD